MKKFNIILLMFSLVISSLLPIKMLDKSVKAATSPIPIGFSPSDMVADPDYPIVYLTKTGSKNLYAVNYETGVIKPIALPFPSEHVEIYGDNVYATLQKVSHNAYSGGNGGIAVINRQSLTLTKSVNVNVDPFDIAIDKDGYLYITPGSGQWVKLKVYHLDDFNEITTPNFYYSLYAQSSIFYSKENSKLYTIDTTVSPRDIQAFEVDKGQIINSYDSPYHGDYDLEEESNITPDGLHLYNHHGGVFDLTPLQAGDMQYSLGMGEDYNDFAFSLENQLTFAANAYGGIDVFTYNTDELLYTLKDEIYPEKLAFQNNGLIVVYSDEKDKYFLEYVKEIKPAPFALSDSAVIDIDTELSTTPPKLTNGMTGVPVNSLFMLKFPQTVRIADFNGITLTGPNGNVPFEAESDHGYLLIQPEKLDTLTNYTLTIQQNALTGYLNEPLQSSYTFSFKTKMPAITNVTLYADTQNEPKSYVFTASATGGQDPEYQFLIEENGIWKVLQGYSQTANLTWVPTRKGTFHFKVLTRSKGSTIAYERSAEIYQSVNDYYSPALELTKSTNELTNKPVTITATATDNVGIDSIRLPNNQIVRGDTSTYSVSQNGTYHFVATDYYGNVTEKDVTITNIDTTRPTLDIVPSTTEPTKNDVLLTVKASDASGIAKIVLPDGTEVNTGNATFSVNNNGTVSFIAVDLAGNQTTKTFVVSNINYIASPVVSPIWNSHTSIKGKTLPNAKVTVKVGTKTIGEKIALADGTFAISIAKQTAGKTVQIIAEKNDVQSAPTSLKVLDKIAPAKPVVNKVTNKTTVITGKAEKYSTVYVYRGSKYLGKAKADSKGNVRIKVAKQQKNSKLTVYAIDSAKNKSASTIVKVY
ncbi:Ig-like domain-containing protein [Gottfriedia sp. OAE603]|uniref:Ig-like domain-containing protein n=1 Tax=Gottfriedia sp. OAE603 TaxID=2663872 RepID=UPI00178AED35